MRNRYSQQLAQPLGDHRLRRTLGGRICTAQPERKKKIQQMIEKKEGVDKNILGKGWGKKCLNQRDR